MKRTCRPCWPPLAVAARSLSAWPPAPAPRPSTPDVVARGGGRELLGQHHQPAGRADVTVTSLITNPNADPHLFETRCGRRRPPGPGPGRGGERRRVRHLDAQPAGRRRRAARGGHRGRPCSTSPGATPTRTSGTTSPAVPKVAAAIPAALKGGAPADAATFTGQPARLRRLAGPAQRELATIKAHFPNVPVAYTERVPGLRVGGGRPGGQDAAGFRPGHRGRHRPRARQTPWPCSSSSPTTTSMCCSTTCRR